MAIEHDLDTPLAKAVRRAGSQTAFGRWIDKRQSTVREWLKAGKELPGELVFTVERHSGISRHELRPDLYPDESGHDATHADDRRRPTEGAAFGDMEPAR